MINKIKNKITSKKGASDIVVVLIIIVIFAAVTFFVFKGVGTKSKDAGTNAETQITTSVTKSSGFSTTGTF